MLNPTEYNIRRVQLERQPWGRDVLVAVVCVALAAVLWWKGYL